MSSIRTAALACALLALACTERNEIAPSPDSGTRDAGTQDSQTWADGGAPDQGPGPGLDGAPADLTAAPDKSKPSGRQFKMGFYPLSHDTGQAALNFVKKAVASDGDLVMLQFMGGIPWAAALADKAYPTAMTNAWTFNKTLVPAGHQVALSLDPLNDKHTGLARNYGAAKGSPLPSPWDTYTFSHPNVIAAYLNYCKKAIDTFKPSHLSIGSEISTLVAKLPGSWTDYLKLHEAVYKGLKKSYPKLPVYATWYATSLLKGWTSDNHATQMAAFNKFIPHSDYLGLSLFPFASKYGTSTYPATMWKELLALSTKPVAVTASGYLATKVTLSGYTFNGTPQKQAAFVKELLDRASKGRFRLVVNTIVRDFDPLWKKTGSDPGAAALKNTGLYDVSGKARPAHAIWIKALKGKP